MLSETNAITLGGPESRGVQRFVVNDMRQLNDAIADPKGYASNQFSQNLYGGMGGGRGWGRWTGVSTSAREISEYGYQVYVTDQDIKYLMERDPTANFIIEGIAGDTWREWLDTDSPLLNQVLLELARMGLIDQMVAADISNRAYGLGILVIGVRDGRNADEPLGRALEAGVGSQGYDRVKHYHTNRGETSGQDAGVPEDMAAAGAGDDAAADAALEKEADRKANQMKEWKQKARQVRDYIDYIEVYSYEEILDFKYDTDPDSDHFGEIEAYKVQILAGEQILETWVHATRCVPFKEDKTTKAPVGKRALDIVFDDLQLLRQTVWSAAEGFYQRVVPPFLVEVKEDFTFGTQGKAELDKQFKEFRTGVREYLGVEGITITPLSGAATTQDPEQTIRMLISRIASGTGVPPKKLILAQRGAVSESVEDRREYEARIGLRQTTYGESRVRRLVDILIDAGLLEEGDMRDFEVEWRPITPMSDLEKAQLEMTLTSARLQYIQQGLPLPTGLEYIPTEDKEMLELLQNRGMPTEQGLGPQGFPGGGGPMGHAASAGQPSGGGGALASLFAGLGPGGQPTPQGGGGGGGGPLAGLFSGNQSQNAAGHSDPGEEGRADWNDTKVRRQQEGFEARIAALLFEAAEHIEGSLLKQVQALGDAPTAETIQDISVPEDVVVTVQEGLADLFEELFLKAADSIQDAVAIAESTDEEATMVRITENSWHSHNLDDDNVLKRMVTAMRSLALVNGKRLAEEAAVQARQALAGGLLAGGHMKDWLNRVAQNLGKFFKDSITAGSTVMSTTVMNRGRDYFLQRNKDKVRWVEFRNPNDNKTSDHCKPLVNARGHDEGLIVEVGSDEYYAAMAPRHFQCRSWWSPVAMGSGKSPMPRDDARKLLRETPAAVGF